MGEGFAYQSIAAADFNSVFALHSRNNKTRHRLLERLGPYALQKTALSVICISQYLTRTVHRLSAYVKCNDAGKVDPSPDC